LWFVFDFFRKDIKIFTNRFVFLQFFLRFDFYLLSLRHKTFLDVAKTYTAATRVAR